MDHYIFDCISKYPFLAEEETLEGWYIMLYDRTARWSGHQDYRCALYQTVNEDPPMIQMVISANQSCEGLSNIQQSEPTVSKGSRHFSDGSVALLFSEDLPQTVVWRKKRSEEEGGGCRFPDWSQGSWTDLKVDENLIRYEPAFHEKDDIDYGNENDDGKDGDTETTGGEQYMKRSQRHAPVGISGIDHPSSHHSRLHRGRRSIPYINTVKMFRKQTSTVQDNTLGKYWIKRQLYNDNMRNFDSFNYRYEEKETNREKRRCYCFTDSETFTPKTDKDQMELFNKAHKYSQTTQKYPEDLNQKSKYPFDTVEFRKKRELSNQDVKEDTMRNYSYRDFKPFIPDDMNIPKILHEKNTFSTKKKTTNLNKKKYSFDIVQQKEKSVKQLLNYNEENINNTKEICFCYDDVEGFLPKNYEIINKLINKMTKFLTMTRKHPGDLKEKSKFPLNFSKIRKKRESNNQNDHGTEGMKHRQKRCLFTETKTSTERYRDAQFENPKTGDPIEPSSKPKTYFGTTENPTARYIIPRSISEDQIIVDDEEEALKKIKNIDQFNRRMRWLNIMRAIESVKNHRMQQSNVDIKHDHGIDGMDGIKHRKKRCLFTETKTSTERYRDVQFENPKTGDPTEPSSKPKTYFGTTENPTARYIIPRSISEDQIIVDDEEEALKKIKNIDQFNRRMRWLNIMRAIESVKNHRMQQSNVDIKHDHGMDGMDGIKHRKKRCLFTETKTSTERYRDVQFENPKTGDPTEPSSKPKTYFGTTENPTARYIRPRSIFEDEVIADDDDEAVKKMKITEQQNRRIRWFNIMRVVESIRNNPMLQPNRNTKDKEYEVIPENTKVPPAVRYLKHAESQGIPYIQALFNWRSMERAYRQRIAEVAYSAYPGQIHPDIVMGDFDQTYDGIEYDFNPWYPEGTMDDPTAYRALTLPGGYKLEPRLSRRPTFEQEHSSDDPESATVFSPIRVADINYSTDQENTSSLNKRMRRSSTQLNQQQHARASFTWRCEMAVDNDVKQLPQPENGAKFLTYGGRVVENNEMSDNDQHNEQESKMSYGCLWLVPRGPNILEFSIIGTGMPLKNQSMQTFAQQLCSGNHGHRKDTSVRNEKKLRLHRPSWVTETRTDDKKRVPVRCPVPPGIVFYGVVPAPPPPSTVSINKDQQAPLRLCAKLVSSADDCTAGQMGPADQMKYTVSECVDQDSSTGTSETMVAQQTIFEAASRGYTIGGSWRRNKRHSATTDTSTIASSVATTSTSSNIPISPFNSHNRSIKTIDNITDQTIGSTTTISSPMTPLSMISSSTEIQPLLGITTIDTKNVTTTTATTLLTGTASILPLSSSQERTTPEPKLPSLSKLSTTTTSPSTSTVSVITSSSYHQVPDYYYRQQQQWQQQHQQPNNNNNDYYYRGRQQQYPPPLPGSTGMDNNYYYIQQQQQQQHSQTQPHWLPEQHPIATNDYSNGYQHQTTDSGGYRTGDYYYRQQQQNYHNHQQNNNRQQKILQSPRNLSLTYQYSNGGSWNVHGDRPLYISSGGGGDKNRDAPVAWNSSTSISSSNNGGWTTAAQQHWWYQQQQQQQRQQQLQQQQRQHQNNRGLGGILSLQPVPLPPLHAEQGAVTISMPTPQPLNPRRQMKPPNHYYLPTLTTKTSSQPYQLRPKSESRYYQEREYQCIGQWTEPQQHISPVAGEKPVMLTYTYLKRLSPVSKEGAQYECFVGTPIPNDEGLNPETTTTILLTEAGTNTKCSRLSDPYRSGMKLVGTKIKKEGACKGYAQPVQDSTGGSWYSLKPQPISPSIPSAENGGGAWYAAPPVPVVAVQGPTTMMPILTGRHTGGNGHTFTSSHNEQNRRPQSANLPPHKNHSFRTVADKRILILAVILFTARRFFN
ncbi:hypothetical protein QTP88_011077 [Uroleucon formosanum]